MIPKNDFNTHSSVNAAHGRGGFRILSGAAVAEEVFHSIQVLADGALTATCEYGDNPAGLVLTEGTVVYGRFKEVTFTGTCIAYLE